MQCSKCHTLISVLDSYPGNLCFGCFVVKDSKVNEQADREEAEFIRTHVQIVEVK